MNSLPVWLCLLFPFVVANSLSAQSGADSTDATQRPTGFTGPEKMPEELLVRRIEGFEKMLDERSGKAKQPTLRAILWEEAIRHIDVMLRRFPTSPLAANVTTTKLKALAELARSDKVRLGELLELNAEIADANPGPRLASENAFYAIQGFVLGARLEQMPPEQRIAGTLERYKAFVGDHPTSQHVPVIRASLVRNLLALDRLGAARTELMLLQRDHAGHRATIRATGELYRVDAIGKPFEFEHATKDGKTIKSEEYLGKVLVVHFWATWSQPSRNGLLKLIELNRKHASNGLQLIGVNLDKSRKQVGKALDVINMSWPQYFDEEGFDNGALQAIGVSSVPLYFVVDRKGILRHITRGDDLSELIEPLLAKPARKG